MIFVAFFQLMPCLCLLVMLPGVTGLSPDREEHREFADSLTNELYANDNECTSSWGVSMLFDLLRKTSYATLLACVLQRIMNSCGMRQSMCSLLDITACVNSRNTWNVTDTRLY